MNDQTNKRDTCLRVLNLLIVGASNFAFFQILTYSSTDFDRSQPRRSLQRNHDYLEATSLGTRYSTVENGEACIYTIYISSSQFILFHMNSANI